MNIQEIRQKYPQYQDLSDEQLGQALHKKFYADMPYEQFAQKAGLGQAQPQENGERGMVESVGRQLGLTVRSGIGGVAGIANMAADPIVAVINALGGNLPIPSQALERTMTRLGLPEPASGTERLAQTVNRGMIAPAGVAKALPQMAGHIGTQIAASGMGAGSANLAEQAGFGPVGQTVAGVVGGIAAPTAGVAALEGGKAALRGGKALLQPMTADGRRMIAARAYQGSASDKDAAAKAAINAPEYVPGSKPTTAQASGDMGLAATEKALRNKFPEDFAQRAAEQDAARQAGLARSFGNETDLAMAQAARDDATKPMRDAAFANAKKVKVEPIVNMANRILKSGPGARQEVGRAMNWVKTQLDGETDPERIYAIRQDINDIIAGKMRDPEKASYQLAAGQLKNIKQVLDHQLEKSAPGFLKYLSTYRDMSTAIRPMEVGQDITRNATNNYREALSGPKFANEMANRGEEVARSGAIASDVLSRVNQDLKRSGAPMGAMKAPGSDTTQNLIAQNILGSTIGRNQGAALPTIANKALGWAYKPFEEQVQQLMLAGALDPKEGAALLSMQLREPEIASGLLGRFLTVPYAGLLGASAQ